MPVPIPTGQLVAPVTPKLKDADAERVRREHEAKIVELQTFVRKIAGA